MAPGAVYWGAMLRRRPEGGFTILELAISIAVIALLLALLVPTLHHARQRSFRDGCANHQHHIGQGWFGYLEDHENQFPLVHGLPAWHYGGVGFSSVDDEPYIDYDRPLNSYLPLRRLAVPGTEIFCCPADSGIGGESAEAGTGSRTVYRSYGTSYRAVADLCNAPDSLDSPRGLSRDEILYPPSRVVLMGDPGWYETREGTGRRADWHGAGGANLLYMDGSVRFTTVHPRGRMRASIYEPLLIRKPSDSEGSPDVEASTDTPEPVEANEGTSLRPQRGAGDDEHSHASADDG